MSANKLKALVTSRESISINSREIDPIFRTREVSNHVVLRTARRLGREVEGESIFAGAAEENITASAPGKHVAIPLSKQYIVARPTEEPVIMRTTV